MKHIKQGKRSLAVILTLLFALGIAMPAWAEGEYPEMSVSINDPGAPVCPPDTRASVTASGGSGSFTYQWYYASSIKEGGTVSSPSKGTAIKGETQAAFAGTASASSAGKYLYCRVTDTVTDKKAYSAGRILILQPPVGRNASPQAATICYDTLTLTLADNYPADHAYNVDKYGAAVAKAKKAAIGGNAAKSISYDSKTNTFKLVFGVDLSKLSQPFQVAMQAPKYVDLTMNVSGVTPTVEAVTLSKTAASLVIGKTLTLTAKPSAAAWQSSNPAVASVSAKGVVKAVGAGTATITVTSKKGGTATCEISVSETLKPASIGGGGSVILQLSTSSKASCFKLYPAGNTKGTPLRQVYLAANSSSSMSFDPGRYVLKIASGKTWLGEEQAFGKSGSYSQSDAYDFTPGVYGIETSTTHGDFRSSSMSGFVG